MPRTYHEQTHKKLKKENEEFKKRYGGVHKRLQQRYDVYLGCADDGTGHEAETGKPLKNLEEWLNA